MTEEQQPRILIVDDKEANLFSLEDALEPLHVKVDRAQSGPEAIELTGKNNYSVILLDVQMPGMDGFETAKGIFSLGLRRTPPIIFVTAISKEEQYVQKGYQAGAVDYILKPLNLNMVRNKVRFCMDLHIREIENENLIAKLLENEAELKRSNEELQQFAYVASHDLQEPIRMVRNYVQLFAKRFETTIDEKAGKYIEYILEGSERMQTLIDDLLMLSRVSSHGKPLEMTDINEVLSTVKRDLKILIDESGAVIEHGDLPKVMADKVQIRQVFQNLIANGIKFRGSEKPFIRIAAAQNDGKIIFSVKDNGIGINPKYFEQIFVIFQRLHTRDKYPGSGIGLALCKKIITRHHGQLWVESQEGHGSTFFFSLARE